MGAPRSEHRVQKRIDNMPQLKEGSEGREGGREEGRHSREVEGSTKGRREQGKTVRKSEGADAYGRAGP